MQDIGEHVPDGVMHAHWDCTADMQEKKGAVNMSSHSRQSEDQTCI